MPGGAASARRASARTSGCFALIREDHKENYEAYGYRRMWKELRRRGSASRAVRYSGSCASTGSRGRSGADGRGAPRRQIRGRSAPRLGGGRLHGLPAGRAGGRRLHLRAVLGGTGVLRVLPRRVQPHDPRLAARRPHARRASSSSTRCRWRSAPASTQLLAPEKRLSAQTAAPLSGAAVWAIGFALIERRECCQPVRMASVSRL